MHEAPLTAHSRGSQRSSLSTIDVSSLVLPLTANDALVLERAVSLKLVVVVGTVVQGVAIVTPPKYSGALIAFAPSRSA